jgi:hypothetical protein
MNWNVSGELEIRTLARLQQAQEKPSKQDSQGGDACIQPRIEGLLPRSKNSLGICRRGLDTKKSERESAGGGGGILDAWRLGCVIVMWLKINL